MAHGSWNKIATKDVEVIKEWFSKYPFANLAIPAKANGLIILDIDDVELYNRLQDEHPEWFSHAWIESTGRGIHVYFKQPTPALKEGFTNRGIEVKILNYTICAPSVHYTGVRYKWLVAPWARSIDVIPAALLAYLNEGRKPDDKSKREGKASLSKPMGSVVGDDGREATNEEKRKATVWLNHYVMKALSSRDRTHNCYHMGEQLRDNDIPYSYAVNVIAPFYAELVNLNVKEKEAFPLSKAKEQIRNAYALPKREKAVRKVKKVEGGEL
jgi:hypothetical protein